MADPSHRQGRGAVTRNLVHDVADLARVEAHRGDRIGAHLGRCITQTRFGLESRVSKQLGVTRHLTAEHGAEASTHVRECVACTHGQTEHHAVHLGDAVARNVVAGHQQNRRARVLRRLSAHGARCLLTDRGLTLFGPLGSVPPAQLVRVIRIGVPAGHGEIRLIAHGPSLEPTTSRPRVIHP